MSKQKAKKTRASNTGSQSQIGFSIGVDWLTYTHTQVQSGQELDDILKALATLASDQIDFCANRPCTDHHKKWAGSGCSAKQLRLWYNPPQSVDKKNAMSWDGNLLSHPNLLPPPHFPMPAEAVEYVKKQLPKYARLEHNPASVTVYDLNTGIPHKHHGYSIVIDDDDVVEQSGELRVSMSARYLDHVDMSELAAYLLTVKDVYGLRCSRFDAALDDHEKQIPLSVVEQARCDRNFFNVRTTSVVVSDNITRNEIGRTMYFGSRQSEAFLRVYDKTIESRGKRIGNRWESEFKGKKADKCLHEWLAAMADDKRTANRLLVDVVLGTVDFRDKSAGDKNRKRCPPLEWFAEMCEMLSAIPVRLRVARPVPTMQRTVDWMKKSTAPSIASLKKLLGSNFNWFMNDLVADGERRMTKQRRKMVADTDVMELCF